MMNLNNMKIKDAYLNKIMDKLADKVADKVSDRIMDEVVATNIMDEATRRVTETVMDGFDTYRIASMSEDIEGRVLSSATDTVTDYITNEMNFDSICRDVKNVIDIDSITESISERVLDEIDIEDICSDVAREVDTYSLASDIEDRIRDDMDDLVDSVKDDIAYDVSHAIDTDEIIDKVGGKIANIVYDDVVNQMFDTDNSSESSGDVPFDKVCNENMNGWGC